MIGTIDVKVNAAHPNLPLAPLFVFVNSPTSPRIINVPKRIGNWEITKVYASATFPDNTTRTVELKNVAGCYVGTIPACDESGSSDGGFQITADGKDENGSTVTGYCLGRGDLFVLDRDGQITSAGVRYYFHFCETQPTSPNKGDACMIDGILKWYNGNAWVLFGGFNMNGVTLNLGDDQASINATLGEVIRRAGGTVIGCLSAFITLSSFADSHVYPTNPAPDRLAFFGQMTRDTLIVTNAPATDLSPSTNYTDACVNLAFTSATNYTDACCSALATSATNYADEASAAAGASAAAEAKAYADGKFVRTNGANNVTADWKVMTGGSPVIDYVSQLGLWYFYGKAMSATTAESATTALTANEATSADTATSLYDGAAYIDLMDGVWHVGYGPTSQPIATTADIPAAQIQSDWTQTDTAALDYIKNKPTIPPAITTYLKTATATANSITVTKQDDTTVGLEVEYEYALRTEAAPASVTCVSGEIVSATGINGTLNIVFPAEVANKSADFIVRVVTTGASELGTLSISGGGTVTPEWLCDALTTTGKIAANKTTIICFSRVAANTYIINALEVK